MVIKHVESVNTLIKKAFMELMNDKYYMDVTVTDLIKKAGVARASFYRNFDSTSDVLDEIVDDMVNTLQEILDPIIASDDPAVWREFLFIFIYEFKSRQKEVIAHKPENASLILFRLNNRFTQKANNLEYMDLHDKYRRFSRLGLLFMVLKGWVDTGMKESPEEIVNYLMEIIPKI